MAKHEVRLCDDARTARLGLDGAFSILGKGNEDNYYIRCSAPAPSICPYCGTPKPKTHKPIERQYRDIINTENGARCIDLTYEYNSYRCRKESGGCGRIFCNAPELAPPKSRVTSRLADYIAQRVMHGDTCKAIADATNNRLTHTGIHDIFCRWCEDRAQSLHFQTPETIAVLSGRTDTDERFTLILSLDNGIRILDILYGVTTSGIQQALRRFDKSVVRYAVIDCNPTIDEAVPEELPGAVIILPPKFWFSMLREDFRQYAAFQLRWRQESQKLEVIMTPEAQLGFRIGTRDNLLEMRPALKIPYERFYALRDIVFDPEVSVICEELEEWFTDLPPDFLDAIEPSRLQLLACRACIRNHSDHPEKVPSDLWERFSQLEDCIRSLRTFSDQLLKARVLYAKASAAESHGIQIEAVIGSLQSL